MSGLNFRPFIPMGAVPMKEGIEEYVNDPDYIPEIKYDGYRMLAWFDTDKVRFTTRSVAIETARAGDPWPTERTDNLPHLRDMMQGDLYGTILDGEIYKPGCTSHDITSMVGGLPETSIANQEREGYVQYIIYDIVQFRGADVTDKPYLERRSLIRFIYRYLLDLNENIVINSPSLGISPQALMKNYIGISEVVDHEKKEETYASLIASGGEGMILKHKDSKYHPGKIHKGKGVPSKVKASKSKGIPHTPWVKWKKKDTFDCVVMGFNPPTREYKGNEPLESWKFWKDDIAVTKRYFYGWPGSIIFGQYKDGELIYVGDTSGISDAWLESFALSPDKFIGKVIEIEAMERIKKTNALREPRFIRFREPWDKAPEECIIE